MNPFGVESHEVSKSDFSAARKKWEQRHDRASKIQDVSAGVAGGAGALIGASGLRGAYYNDYPKKKIAHEAKIAAMKPGIKRATVKHLVRSKPGFPVYATVAGATGAGFVARHYKNAAKKQAVKYTPIEDRKPVAKSEINKASAKRLRQRARRAQGMPDIKPLKVKAPGPSKAGVAAGVGATLGVLYIANLAHRKTREVTAPVINNTDPMSKGLAPKANEESIKQHKTAQGVIGGAAAIGGLTAFGLKGGGKLLPKLTHNSADGMKYAKHLDSTANAVLFGTAGVGGAAGLHGASIYHAEGKLPKNDAPKNAPASKNPVKIKKSKTTKLVALGAGGAAALAGGAYIHHNRTGKPYKGWYDKAKPLPRIPAGPAQTSREYSKEEFVPRHLRGRQPKDMSKEEWEQRLRRSLKTNP